MDFLLFLNANRLTRILTQLQYCAAMRKHSASSINSEHSQEMPKRTDKIVTFDYHQLDCFLTNTPNNNLPKDTSKAQRHKSRPSKPLKQQPIPQKKPTQHSLSHLYITRRNKGKLITNPHRTFNNSLLLLEYENHEEPGKSKERKDESEEDNQQVKAIVKSCLRVITEDTEHSSNPVSTRYTHRSLTEASPQAVPTSSIEHTQYYYGRTPRNRRAISLQESAAFVIHPERIQADGRTTVMVRNIPNKYTQEMLIRLFQGKHRRKFDFFYMPIDYYNNCNVGYAFINFISTKFIPDFYAQFHNNRWDKFNSFKVCHLCYARLQGTAQLAKHFENSSVLQQRDRRYRPLIGLKSLPGSISELVNKQKEGQSCQPAYRN